MTLETGLIERMISRSASFAGARLNRTGCQEVKDIQQIEEIPLEQTDQRYLSIAELGLPRARGAKLERDYLVIVMLPSGRKNDAPAEPGLLTVIMPDTLRSSSRETATAIFVNDVVVAPISDTSGPLSVLIYSLKRSKTMTRVASSLQSIVDVLEKTEDYVRALSLSQAIIDRVEMLEEWGDAEIVLAGCVSQMAAGIVAKGGTQFLAFVPEGTAMVRGQRWWVRGSNLQIGETADATVPVTEGIYLLLKYGARSTQQSVRRYIDELRRMHALKRDELHVDDEGEIYTSYVDKQRASMIDKLNAEANILQNAHTVGKRREELSKAIEILQQAVELNPSKSDISDKILLLEARRKWIGRFGEAIVELPPVSTPIVVQVSDDLVPKVDSKGGQGRFLSEYIPAMRNRIEDEIGVSLPEVQMTSDAALSSGSYSVVIHKYPVYTGHINANLVFCTSSILTDGAVHHSSEGGQIVDALTGEKGVWLSEDQANTLPRNEAMIYSDAEMLIRHIEIILRRHLASFLGLQEVEELLKRWAEDKALSMLIETILPDKLARLGFARLLRTLVREQVPIVSANDILCAIEGISLDAEGLASAIRVVRLRLRPSLAVNCKGLRRVKLPLEVENSASIWLTRQNGRLRFDIPPQPFHDLVDDLHRLILSADAPSILVVANPDLRPFIQRIAEFSLGCLMVQASEEVLNIEELSEQAFNAETKVRGAPSHG